MSQIRRYSKCPAQGQSYSLLNIPSHILEEACAAYWNSGVWPEQIQWAGMVEIEDHRVPIIRRQILAALSAAILAGLPSQELQDNDTAKRGRAHL